MGRLLYLIELGSARRDGDDRFPAALPRDGRRSCSDRPTATGSPRRCRRGTPVANKTGEVDGTRNDVADRRTLRRFALHSGDHDGGRIRLRRRLCGDPRGDATPPIARGFADLRLSVNCGSRRVRRPRNAASFAARLSRLKRASCDCAAQKTPDATTRAAATGRRPRVYFAPCAAGARAAGAQDRP